MPYQYGFEEYAELQTLPPPLPRTLRPRTAHDTDPTIVGAWLKSFRTGCYDLEFELYDRDDSRALLPFVGTLRCEAGNHSFVASGDLYLRPRESSAKSALGVPIFPRRAYRYYLKLEELVLAEQGHEVQFVLTSFRFLRGSWWVPDREFRVKLRRVAAPPNFPRAEDYFQGTLLDSFGNVVGDMRLGWVSEMLRQGTLEIAGVDDVHRPPRSLALPRGDTEISWESLFAEVGWDLKIKESQKKQPSFASQNTIWTNGELHRAFRELRSGIDLDALLDREWRYLLFCVPQLGSSRNRGFMFDTGFFEGNEFPREGAAIAAGLEFSSVWQGIFSETKGQAPTLQSEEAIYFRTAVHEIGHAMGLTHQSQDAVHLGFMTPLASARKTVALADPTGADRERFIDALHWSFAPQDALRLKHWPDISVRPGGQPFRNTAYRQYLSARTSRPWPQWNDSESSQDLQLLVQPLPKGDSLPLGAPARVELMLRNGGSEPIDISQVELSMGTLEVVVTDPASVKHRIQPLLHILDGEEAMVKLGEGETIRHGLTLLFGDRGPLFTFPGRYQIQVTWSGEADGIFFERVASCSVQVRDAISNEQARLAGEIFDTSELLHLMVIGGEYGDQVEKLVDRVGKSKTLIGAHYRWILLKYRYRRGDDLGTLAKGLGNKKFHASTTELRRLWRDQDEGLNTVIEKRLEKIADGLGKDWELPNPPHERMAED